MELDFLLPPLTPDPGIRDVLGRLGATIAAGGVIGINRERGGHAAGFRTTILVGLAACLAMVQGNLLLATPITEAQSAVRLDVLRLALGTLTGVGFIGAGAIMHRGDLVTGVTTAATLWVITAIGLCFGAGQYFLGAVATLASFIVLSPMKSIRDTVKRKESAVVTLRIPANSPLPDLKALLQGDVSDIEFLSRKADDREGLDALLVTYALIWSARSDSNRAVTLAARLDREMDLVSFTVSKKEL